MIEVGNVKMGWIGESDIYVGRWNQKYVRSLLGNPFTIGKDGSREEVIEKYREWLKVEYDKDQAVFREIERIRKLGEKGKIRLMCWCKPKACHGDVILEWMS